MIEVNYPMENIKSLRAREYLETIEVDVFNEDTNIEDLHDLSDHLLKFIQRFKVASLTPTVVRVDRSGAC